jgi:hypothetical protein
MCDDPNCRRHRRSNNLIDTIYVLLLGWASGVALVLVIHAVALA